jgi:hypothetical protein
MRVEVSNIGFNPHGALKYRGLREAAQGKGAMIDRKM